MGFSPFTCFHLFISGFCVWDGPNAAAKIPIYNQGFPLENRPIYTRPIYNQGLQIPLKIPLKIQLRPGFHLPAVEVKTE